MTDESVQISITIRVAKREQRIERRFQVNRYNIGWQDIDKIETRES